MAGRAPRRRNSWLLLVSGYGSRAGSTPALHPSRAAIESSITADDSMNGRSRATLKRGTRKFPSISATVGMRVLHILPQNERLPLSIRLNACKDVRVQRCGTNAIDIDAGATLVD